MSQNFFSTRKKPFAWSPSAIKDFETCAKRYYHTRIAKDYREAESDQLIAGNKFHEALANAMDPVKQAALPPELSEFTPWVSSARRGVKVIVEQQLAMTRDLRPAEWFGKDAWLRVIVDLGIFLPNHNVAILDWKTGKPSNTDDLQLFLSALMIMVHYPEVQATRAGFVFVKHGNQIDARNYTRADIPSHWVNLLPRIKKMNEAYDTTTYPPTPGNLCARWCPVATCEHHGKRR